MVCKSRYSVLLVLFFLSIRSLSFGQSNPEDTIVLQEAIKEYAGAGTIVYIDSINKERKLPESISSRIKEGKVKDIYESNTCIRLTKA